jgi:hypothetical protein
MEIVSTPLFDALGPLLSGPNVSKVASAPDIDERRAASALEVTLDRYHDGSAADDLVRMAGSLSELFAKR